MGWAPKKTIAIIVGKAVPVLGLSINRALDPAQTGAGRSQGVVGRFAAGYQKLFLGPPTTGFFPPIRERGHRRPGKAVFPAGYDHDPASRVQEEGKWKVAR